MIKECYLMKECYMRIELKSDLCVSDGGIYNSMLDTDVCYDDNGIPYIPAKRIKGCLREAAIELQDWGMEIDINKLFGKGGSYKDAAGLRIGNAHIEYYKAYKESVLKNKDSLLMHRQNVINHFTYIRTQTSIDYESGAASKGSLRTMRVVNKGTVFIAKVYVEPDMYEWLKACCTVLKHMGIARTRGLGEVSITLMEQSDIKDNVGDDAKKHTGNDAEKYIGNDTKKYTDDVENYIENHAGENADLLKDSNYLEYEIFLEEPVVCKSINGGEANTLDYIEGSKMLGIISGGLRKKGYDFVEFMSGNPHIICSNAYVSKNGKRYSEVPGYIYEIKNENDYINKLYETAGKKKEYQDKQLNQMKHSYISISGDELQKENVDVEIRYHHRRPEDKSIGRASAKSDVQADFYQIASIREGQTFKGYILGDPEKIKVIYEILTDNCINYIGMGKSSEYGRVRIRVTELKKINFERTKKVKKFSVNLVSPAIIYNQNAMVSSSPDDLTEEMMASFNIKKQDCISIKYFLKYSTVGGFNVTWNKRKPTISAFDKGTAVVFELAKPIELVSDIPAYIGERTAEGYGEVQIVVSDDSGAYHGKIAGKDGKREIKSVTISDSEPLVKEICKELFKEYIKYSMVNIVNENRTSGFAKGDKNTLTADYRPVISNLSLLCKECDTFEKVKYGIEQRYDKNTEKKDKKFQYAKNILDEIENCIKTVCLGFKDKYEVKGWEPDEDKVKIECLTNYLTHAKYRLRNSEEGRG